MDNQDSRKIVPEQQVGSATNVEYTYAAASPQEARMVFKEAVKKLLDVNHWNDYAGKGTADFTVIDMSGKETEAPLQKGFYFKIDIPGPGTFAGDGFDWVQVETIDSSSNEAEDWESVAVRVRPTSNPTKQGDDVAHFFSADATSNFVVRREKTNIIAGVYGRNEIPNTAAKNPVDKTRNAAIGLTAVSGASSVQWNALVKGIIGK